MPVTPYPNVPAGFGLARIEFTLAEALHDPMVIIGYEDTAMSPSAVTSAESIFDATTPLMADFSSSLTCLQVSVVENIGGVLNEAVSTGASVNGSVSGPPVPANTAVLIQKNSGLIGRHFRGRVYFPGWPQSGVDSGGSDIKATALASLATDFGTWLTALGTAHVPMKILHRSPTIVPTDVIQLVVEGRLATQSRRLRKVAGR